MTRKNGKNDLWGQSAGTQQAQDPLALGFILQAGGTTVLWKPQIFQTGILFYDPLS